jgi:two-component system, OmpR family, sensor kinase
MIAALREPAGLRRRLLAVVVLAVTVALAAATAGFNLLLAARLDRDANDLVRSRAQAALSGLRVGDGRLVVPDREEAEEIDRPVWIFAGRRAIESPERGAAVEAAAHRLAGGPRRRIDVGETRLLALPAVEDGRRVGTVVAAVSLEPYERTERIAFVTSIALAAGLLLAAIAATGWALAAGLRPVAHMTAQAADWSERDLDRRFDLGPPRDELTQLAATLDALLARLAAGLRREQRFSAELSHELRTPLARIRAQAQLALEDDLPEAQADAWTAVERSADEMARTLDALLAAARADTRERPGEADALPAVEAVAERHRRLAAERGVEVRVVPPERPLRVGVDGELLERALQPIVDNACRYTASEVTIAVRLDREAVVFEVADDGPGVRDEERERIFEPAVRGAAGTALREGTGLGLALARRLAEAGGGTVEAGPGAGGSFVLRFPRA